MSRHENRRRTYAALSLLLQYPDSTAVRMLPEVRKMAAGLDADSQHAFDAFADWLSSTPMLAAQSHYVDIFDRKRRACLYLSYYLNGDTRRRGMALVAFKELYRDHGFVTTDAELPDFLPTLLQFCAIAEVEVGDGILAAHRAGLEVLHKALVDATSPYAHLAQALLHIVPVEAGNAEAVLRLIETGPPSELVGLEPFSAPERVGV